MHSVLNIMEAGFNNLFGFVPIPTKIFQWRSNFMRNNVSLKEPISIQLVKNIARNTYGYLKKINFTVPKDNPGGMCCKYEDI